MNTTTPTRVCDFPYAALDKGLLAAVVIGGFLLFVAFLCVIAVILLVQKQRRAVRYIELDYEAIESVGPDDKTPRNLNIAIFLLLLSLVVGGVFIFIHSSSILFLVCICVYFYPNSIYFFLFSLRWLETPRN